MLIWYKCERKLHQEYGLIRRKLSRPTPARKEPTKDKGWKLCDNSENTWGDTLGSCLCVAWKIHKGKGNVWKEWKGRGLWLKLHFWKTFTLKFCYLNISFVLFLMEIEIGETVTNLYKDSQYPFSHSYFQEKDEDLI